MHYEHKRASQEKEHSVDLQARAQPLVLAPGKPSGSSGLPSADASLTAPKKTTHPVSKLILCSLCREDATQRNSCCLVFLERSIHGLELLQRAAP